MENDGTFYAPSVTKTIKLPEVLEAAGYSVVYIKSHQDLPTSPVVGKTVLVIDLPATQLGDLRKENLQLNSNFIFHSMGSFIFKCFSVHSKVMPSPKCTKS